MRTILSLGGLAAAALLSAASVVQQQAADPNAAGANDPYGCGAACGHYFGCRGIDDQALWAECAQGCEAQSPDPNLVAQYTQLDCATAIQLVEENGALGGQGGGGQQPPGGPPPGAQPGVCNADCNGCVWDGSTCYQAHVAAGAGTVIECDACCCAAGGPAQSWD